MWTCRNCSHQLEAPAEVCPSCGAVDVEISAADDWARPGRFGPEISAEEPSTEYELHSLPDPGRTVECHLAVTGPEAAAVASRLGDLGIPALVSRDDSGDGPVHRIRVPLADLPRALAEVDLLQKLGRRRGRP
ncbi:hypothetical protein [Tautonia plasticadhaerens]|uniref:Uncharacterized protein n=1 Tax=Tautonia plasticadhaerens TaxID=2527974 RepID=A0A518HAL1_9BACT|nr:hypothetical protein [Tautonia plasticadhaerens]QDV37891.1 hypothetical protein ElP_58380 [Tautonia plasticadhaerens]